jgi:hypothetical protein
MTKEEILADHSELEKEDLIGSFFIFLKFISKRRILV